LNNLARASGTPCLGAQDVERPAYVQPLAEPAGARRARAGPETERIVVGAKDADRVVGHRDGWRHLG